MGERNHLPANPVIGQPKSRVKWLFGGTVAAVAVGGLMMQYVRSPATQAASDPPAGSARVQSQGNKPELLARVGNESITYDAVAEEAVKRFGKEVLDDLIHRLIIQQACEKNGVTVSEQEITDEINRIAKRFNLDAAQWQQMLQAERNITPIQYRQSVIFPMLALKKLAGEDVEISEEEMKQAFVRTYGPRVKARMIMFDNQRRAQEGWDLLDKNPEDFEKLAGKLSVDPSSRALGGQIPPIARYGGKDMETLEKVAFKLKMNEVSGVVEIAPSRFVILKCEGRTEPVVTDIEEVRSTLYDELKESKVQMAVAKKFEQIKKTTSVDNYLTQTSTRPEKNAGGPGAAPGKGEVQPVSGTQQKRPASAAGNPRATKN